MEIVLLLMDNEANRSLLENALASRYRVVAASSAADLEQPFDLGLVDGRALERYLDAVGERRRAEEPAILPFLLATSRADVGLATRHLWKTIDDIITTPIERVELDARIASLLALRRLSLEFSRRLFEASPQAIYVLDRAFRVTAVNPAAEELFGWLESDVVGGQYPCVAEADRPFFDDRLAEAAAGGRVRNVRMAHVTATGKPLTVLLSIVPLVGKTGEVQYLLIVTMDITELVELQARLEASEARYRKLVESIEDVVLELAPDGTLTYASPALERLAGYSPSEVVGTQFAAILDPASAEEFSRRFASLAPHTYGHCELSLRTKGGERLAALCTFADSDLATVDRTVVVLTDITSLKEAERDRQELQERLFRSQKLEAIGQLAGGIAHDFNNMLTIILGNLELARASVEKGSELDSHLEAAAAAAERSSSLIAKLLGFARKQATMPTSVDLNATVEDMLGMLRCVIGEDIELVWKPAPDLRPVWIDPAQLDQIVTNLVVNARDAISGPGIVTLRTENKDIDAAYCVAHPDARPGPYVMFEISDTGCGMTDEVMAHIFEPFFTTKDQTRASGLGLATVYGIVRQNDGFINVYSEPGNGSTFRVYLPQAERPTATKSGDAAEAVRAGAGTVLLVEDEEAILKLAAHILENAGYSVFTASDPLAAAGIVEQAKSRIDLLVTDVVLPAMHGTELARRLRESIPSLKVLYISGYSEEIVQQREGLEEAARFLQKPFTSRELLRAVAEALGERR